MHAARVRMRSVLLRERIRTGVKQLRIVLRRGKSLLLLALHVLVMKQLARIRPLLQLLLLLLLGGRMVLLLR